MSDELQSNSVESEVNEPAVIENPDNGADLAAASESEHSENTETVDEVESEASKKQAYINKQYGEIQQGKRDLVKANDQIASFEQSERERQAAQVGNIPDVPNEFDFDDNTQYLAAVKKRDDAIIAQTNYNATNNVYLQQQQNAQLQQQQAAQQAAIKLQGDFVTSAKGAGATDKEFSDVINTLNNGGMTVDTASGIMELGADGYFIAKHLAANPQEANNFNNLSQMQQGMKLVELKQKASALKPKNTKAPTPADNLQGTTADFSDQQYKYIGGSEIDVGSDW